MAELKYKLASTIDIGQERIIGNDEADSSILSSGTIFQVTLRLGIVRGKATLMAIEQIHRIRG